MKNIPVRHITHSLKEPDITGSFTIRDVGQLVAENDLVQQLHRHSFFFVLAVDKGTGHHSIDFTPYAISDHSVFFMRPGQVHQLTLEKGSTGYLMQFSTGFYSPVEKSAIQLFRKVSSKNFCRPEADQFNKLFSLLSYIFQEYTAKQEKYIEVIRSGLDIFFIELFRQSKNPQSLPAGSNPFMQDRLEELLELLEQNISTHKQVAQYAGMLHLTPYQLNSVTRTMLGKTCSELINDYIILEAKRYLLATSNQVNQVADQLGYEDVSYFIRFFKKHTGHSPEAFRQNFR